MGAGSAGLSLGAFVRAAASRALYRKALRLARDAPGAARPELEQEIARRMRDASGPATAAEHKWLLSEGEAQLKQLRDVLGLRH